MTSQQEKCARLQTLHTDSEPFIIPNPWDVGSARLLEGLGFSALATTSSGFAYTLGRLDGEPTLDDKLRHCAALAEATTVPVSVDFEDGFADDPVTVAGNVRRLIESGVAGCSIEDFSRDGRALYEPAQAAERVQAAVEAARSSGMAFQLIARAENLLRGVDDLEDTIRRLQSFQAAGADVLYAPGIRSLDDLATVTRELDKPFNVLGVFIPGATLADFAAAGAQRVSLGAALTWACVQPLFTASAEMLERGTFGWLRHLAPAGEIRRLLSS
jgi:2-methylisocitrate lyase-like PEP mutase family enzyme